ncbi:sigma-54 interaction domain-containing protein, partial [Candidatus Riflebacteria bacterium]
ITGFSSDEVAGKPLKLFKKEIKNIFSNLHKVTGEEDATEIVNLEGRFISKHGKELHLVCRLKLLSGGDGKIEGGLGTFTDMTVFFQANEIISLPPEAMGEQKDFENMVGSSEIMRNVYRRIKHAAESDVTVLITGESGTGKELAAKAVHSLSNRSKKPFFAVNCSAIAESLLESELFGHRKGAFTGAVEDKMGIFQAADGGTLFLDEISDLSVNLQLKLLRFLQENEIRRVGEFALRKVDVRLITASNRDLTGLLEKGNFREDFYYRIKVFEIVMPPLKDRIKDVPPLVAHFIRQFSTSHRKGVQGITREVMNCLLSYDWPGNVRELQNTLEQAFVMVRGDRIGLSDLPQNIQRGRGGSRTALTKSSTGINLSPNLKMEQEQILHVLMETGGNKTRAAKILGYSRVTLWKKMRKLQIEI